MLSKNSHPTHHSPLATHLSLLTSHFSRLTSHFSRLTSHFPHTIGHLNLLFNLILVPVSWDFLAASIISSTCNACSALIRGSIFFTNDSPIFVAPSCH